MTKKTLNFLSVSRTCVNCNCLQFYLHWKNLSLFWFTNVVWFYSVLEETSNLNIVHRSGKTKGRSFYFFVHVSKALSRILLEYLMVTRGVYSSCSKLFLNFNCKHTSIKSYRRLKLHLFIR